MFLPQARDLEAGGSPPAKPDPDAALVRACQASAPESHAEFQTLYERHRDRVYRTCLRLTGNDADALDAAQETFRTVLRRIDRFHFRSRFSTWLYRIACNTSLDVRGNRRRRELRSLDVLLESPTWVEPPDIDFEGPEACAARRELRDGIQLALLRLTPKYRQVIVLRYLEGLSYPEIAAELEVSLGTVKSRMSRGHTALDRELGPILARFAS